MSSVEIKFNPPTTQPEGTFDLYITLADTHPNLPMAGSKYTIPIVISKAEQFDISKIKTKSEANTIEFETPIMTYEPIDVYDNLRVKFSDLVLYPNDIANYTSENEGSNVFDIQY